MNPNRDAFHLALTIGALFFAFLVVLGIAAWNTRIAFLPLTPKEPKPSAAMPAHRFPEGSGLWGYAKSPAPLGVAAPGTVFNA